MSAIYREPVSGEWVIIKQNEIYGLVFAYSGPRVENAQRGFLTDLKDITGNPLWLKAQVPSINLSNKFLRNQVMPPSEGASSRIRRARQIEKPIADKIEPLQFIFTDEQWL